jgi:four helix bundle protein
MPFKFEQLTVWQLGLQLSVKVNELCRTFPKEELFVLTSQIKRVADSVSLNIAEGSTGQTNLEFKRFLNYAIRSGAEVVGCLYIARTRKYISEDNFKELYDFIDSLVKKIQALRNSLN